MLKTLPNGKKIEISDTKPILDNENPEWTDADFAQAKSVSQIAELSTLLSRPKTQTKIMLNLDNDLLKIIQATGKDWRMNINQTLRKAYIR
ncbi:MAG: BrnA antitoxin family protein [Neisseriaceae bacterium]|nr:BrnA antitoxin family protein [Neisseriaceae bacterium]